MNWGRQRAYNENDGQTFRPLTEPKSTPGNIKNSEQPRPEQYRPVEIIKENDEITSTVKETALVQFDIQAYTLAEILKYKEILVDIHNPGSVKEAQAAKTKVRGLRLKVQNREKELNSDLNRMKADLKSNATAITSRIKETEDHLAKELKKWDDYQEKLREEDRKKEAARVEDLKKNMRTLEEMCGAGLVPGLSSDRIGVALECLMETEIPEEVFQENYQMACNLLGHAIESTKAALQKRQAFDAEKAVLKIQTEINAQHSWFNKNFGWSSTMDEMETALELLEKMEPAEHLMSIVADQKLAGQDIIVAARARKAEADRLEAERLYSNMWDEAHKMNSLFIEEKARIKEVPLPSMALPKEPEQQPEIKKEVERGPVPEIMKRSVGIASCKAKVVKEKSETRVSPSFVQSAAIKTQLKNLNDLRESGKDLSLHLLTDTESLMVMRDCDGINHILDAVERQLMNILRGLPK